MGNFSTSQDSLPFSYTFSLDISHWTLSILHLTAQVENFWSAVDKPAALDVSQKWLWQGKVSQSESKLSHSIYYFQESKMSNLKEYLVNQKYILLAYLFHPQEGETNGQIDIAVVLQDELSNFKKGILRFKLMVDLANILKKQVDVTILNNTSSILRHQLFTQPIFVRDSLTLANELVNYDCSLYDPLKKKIKDFSCRKTENVV